MTSVTPIREAHECVAEEELLELVNGGCNHERALRLLSEVESCADCHALMLEAVRALAEQSKGRNLWNSPPEAHWPAGTFVANRYRILRRLGSGGMGDVYEALDTELTQRVALKTIGASFSRHETSLERLKQEVRLARRVVHPNVCRVLEFGRHRDARGNRFFLTMELLQGELLSTVLRRDGSMAPQAATEVVRQVAEGLRAIHEQNIVHRDVKSSNILLTTDSDGAQPTGSRRAVLLDFGIARSLDTESSPLTAHGLVGTPDYMAPEQLRGEAASPATDVYALGLVLFELLGGRLLSSVAQGRSPWATQQRAFEPPSLPAALPSDVPAELVALVRWCLAPEPAARPPTMDVLLQALKPGAKAPTSHRGGAARRGLVVALPALMLALASGFAFVRGNSEAVQSVNVSQTTPPPVTDAIPQPALETAPSSAAPAPSPAVLAEVEPEPAEERASRVPAERRPSPRRAAPDSQRLQCSPPYYYDEQGIRIFRKECL